MSDAPDSVAELEADMESKSELIDRETREGNLNLRIAEALGLEPSMILKGGFDITTDGSDVVTLVWTSQVQLSMEFFNEILASLFPRS